MQLNTKKPYTLCYTHIVLLFSNNTLFIAKDMHEKIDQKFPRRKMNDRELFVIAKKVNHLLFREKTNK